MRSIDCGSNLGAVPAFGLDCISQLRVVRPQLKLERAPPNSKVFLDFRELSSLTGAEFQIVMHEVMQLGFDRLEGNDDFPANENADYGEDKTNRRERCQTPMS